MSRKILITTLSTSNYSPSQSFYYYEQNGKEPVYCSGLISVEPGSKHILSLYDIERIIVLGSSDTYNSETDTLKVSDLRAYETGTDSQTRPSVLSLYQKQISTFLREGEGSVAFHSDVDEKRRQALLDIVREVIAKEYPDIQPVSDGDLFAFVQAHSSNPQDDLFKKIRAAIKADIESEFEIDESYKKYLDDEAVGDILDKAQASVDSFMQNLDIESFLAGLSDSLKSGLDREFGMAHAAEKLAEIIRDKFEDYAFERFDEHEALVLAATAVEKLKKQVNDLKTRRIDTEIDCFKAMLYAMLDDGKKMKPLSRRRNVSLDFIPIGGNAENETDNSGAAISQIIKYLRPQNPNDEVEVFVDVQGGYRTDAYVRNAALSIIGDSSRFAVAVHSVIATDYSRANFASKILNETSNYRIGELVSALTAFTKYGKASALKEYCISLYNTDGTRKYADGSPEMQLVEDMVIIDRTLSLCDANGFITIIKRLKKLFDGNPNLGSGVFRLVVDEIKNEYAALLKDTDDICTIVEWALNKDLIMQAYTLFEVKMPERIVADGICFYAYDEESRKAALSAFARAYNSAKTDKWLFKDICHCFIKKRIHKESPLSAPGLSVFSAYENAKGKHNADVTGLPAVYIPVGNVLGKYKRISDLRNNLVHGQMDGLTDSDRKMLVSEMENAIALYRLYTNAVKTFNESLPAGTVRKPVFISSEDVIAAAALPENQNVGSGKKGGGNGSQH